MSEDSICNGTGKGLSSVRYEPIVDSCTWRAVQLMRNPFSTSDICIVSVFRIDLTSRFTCGIEYVEAMLHNSLQKKLDGPGTIAIGYKGGGNSYVNNVFENSMGCTWDWFVSMRHGLRENQWKDLEWGMWKV